MTYKVYLVEDSVQLLEVLVQMIESSGNMTVVGSADNPDDAILALEGPLEMDAVVIDLQLRGGTGLAILGHLSRTGNPKKLLRVVLTNRSTEVFRFGAQQLGAEHFFDKSMEFMRALEVLAEDAERRGSGALT